MQRCFLLFLAASLSWSQTSPTAPGQTAPQPTQANSGAANSGLKLRGADAVAAADPERVVAIIHGDKITAAQAQQLLKRLPPEQMAKIAGPDQMQKALENVYLALTLAEQGDKLKLGETSPWKEQLENYRISILANAYIQHLSQESFKPSDAEVSKYYSDHASEFEQMKLSLILISYVPAGSSVPAGVTSRSPEEALKKATDVVTRARAGGDFAALAKQESDDKASAAKGGDVGTISAGKNNLPKEMTAALAKLNKGDVSDPVDEKNGYYVFRLNDRIRQSLDEVKPQIIEAMRSDHAKQVVQNTVNDYKVQVQDSDFFSGPKPTGPIQPAPKTPSLQNPPAH